MKLQYRGVSYDQSTGTEAVGTTQGKFRGRKWTSFHLKQSAVTKPSGLVYRGVAVK